MKRIILLLMIVLGSFNSQAQIVALIQNTYSEPAPTVNDYQAILDRAGVLGYTIPSALQRITQQALLDGLKTDGIWDQLDVIYVLANDGSEEFGRLNWKDPELFELQKNGQMDWVVNAGVKQNNRTSYYNTGWIPNTDGVNITQNSTSSAVYVNSPSTYLDDFQYYYGFDHTAINTHSLMYDHKDGMTQGRANTSGWVGGGTPYNNVGFYHLDRADASNQEIYIDGVEEDSDADSSGGFSDGEMYVIGTNVSDVMTYPTDSRIAFFGVGQSLGSEASNYSNRVQTYVDDIVVPNIFDAANLYPSQYSERLAPSGGIRMTGVVLNSTGSQFATVSDNEAMMNVYDLTDVAWDLSQSEFNVNIDIEAIIGGTTAFQEIIINNTFDKLLVAENDTDLIVELNLGTVDDLTSTITLGGTWDPSSQANQYGMSLSDDGTLLTMGGSGKTIFRTYTLGIPNSILGSNPFLSEGEAIATAGSDPGFLTSFNEGDKLLYTDYDNDNEQLVQGGYDIPDTMNSNFSATESLSNSGNGMWDVLKAGVFIKPDNSFIMGSWGNDHLLKFRDITYSTFESGKDYEMNIFDDPVAMNTTYQLSNISTTWSIVLDINIPANGVSVSDNELVGSTSSNYLRFDHNESTNLLYIQMYDGSISNSNTATFIPDGKYHQITVTYSSANNQKVYIDGTLVDTGSSANTPNWSGLNVEQILQIGSRSNGTSWGEFSIKGVQMYERELTSTEVGDIAADFSDVQTGVALYLGDKKDQYFWQDESGFGRHTGVESAEMGDEDEQLINPSFTTDSFWQSGSGWTIADGRAIYDGTGGTSALYWSSYGTDYWTTGNTYRVEVDVAFNEGVGDNSLSLDSWVAQHHLDIGVHHFNFLHPVGGAGIYIYGRDAEDFILNSLSVIDITDYVLSDAHQQSNAASKYEVNDDANWTQNSADISISTKETYGEDSQYSIEVWGDNNQTYSRGIQTPSCEIGEIYDIYFDAKWSGSGTYGEFRNSSGFTPGVGDNPIDTEWGSYSYLGRTATVTSPVLQWYVPSSVDNRIWVDNLRVESRQGDKYNSGNPASYFDEQSDLSEWVSERSATMVFDTDAYEGAYSIKVTSGAETYSNAYIDIDGLDIGATYDISFWAKPDTYNASSPQQFYINSGNGWTAGQEISITTSEWKLYTTTATANATVGRVHMRANRNPATVGQVMWTDAIKVVKQ